MRRSTHGKLAALFVLPLAALALPGCGGDGTTLPPDERGTIEVVNQTADLHVFKVQPRLCGTTVWDVDLLGENPCTFEGGANTGCIAPSGSREFVVEAACYDLRAELADLEARQIVASDSIMDFVVLVDGTRTWTISGTPQGPSGPE